MYFVNIACRSTYCINLYIHTHFLAMTFSCATFDRHCASMVGVFIQETVSDYNGICCQRLRRHYVYMCAGARLGSYVCMYRLWVEV